jgi:hypothetical protein
MSYVFPSVTINYITYTAKRWGQFPTITYITGGTAGSEVVTVTDSPMSASDITIKIEDGVSTNAQIKAAILNSNVTVGSLAARDLVGVVIITGHTADTNSAVSATPMTGGSDIQPPIIIPPVAPVYVPELYTGSHSYQPVATDLTISPNAGSADGSNPKYIAAAMFNIFGDTMIADANYIAGVIGAFSILGAKATSYPAGAVLGQITDGVTDADGAFVAYVDGDGDVTKANAAFKAMSNNSTSGSGFNFGLDLYSPAHDGYNDLAILVADVRFNNGTKMHAIGDTIVFTNLAGDKTATITLS